MVLTLEQWVPPRDQQDTNPGQHSHEREEDERDRRVFGERMNRLDQARPRQEGRENREQERERHQTHVPDLEHPPVFLNLDRVEEGRSRQPG